jgi:hypothetical protein
MIKLSAVAEFRFHSPTILRHFRHLVMMKEPDFLFLKNRSVIPDGGGVPRQKIDQRVQMV